MKKKNYSVPNDELSAHAHGQQIFGDLVLLLEDFVLNPILQPLYATHLHLYYTRYCPFAGKSGKHKMILEIFSARGVSKYLKILLPGFS